MKNTHSSVRGFCEEFSSHVYEDKNNHSVLINVDHEWFMIMDAGVKRLGYKLVHITEMPKSITCVYQKA